MSPRAFYRARRLGTPAAFRRGVALLPSLFTVGNMFCGYYAIILGSRHRFEWAVTFIVLAGILDSLDGRIARMTNSESEFGKELDSLSDFLSFGLAPALVLYHWGFSDLGRLGWLLPFLLPVAGAMRLARFNVQAGKIDKRYFVGLPIPAGAAAAVLPLYYLPAGIPEAYRAAALAYVVALSWLMVSRLKYRSFKELDLRQRRSPMLIFVMAVVLVTMAWQPTLFMLTLAVIYAASGPAAWLAARLSTPEAPPAKEDGTGEPS